MTLLEPDTETRVITGQVPVTQPPTSTNKPEAAHIVHRPEDEEGGGADETDHAYVMRAMVEGFPITALCGHVFTPSRGAKNLPVCSECKDIWDSLPDDGGGWVKE